MYGQIVSAPRKLSSSGPPPTSAKPRHEDFNHSFKQTTDAPVAPTRRKTSSKSSRDSHHYDIPKAAGRAATEPSIALTALY